MDGIVGSWPALGGAVGGAAVAGGLAGAGSRRLLARLRRGARVAPPWCELVVGTGWALAAGLVAGGLVPGRWLPLLLALTWFGATAGAVDVLRRRLPDALTWPAWPGALAVVAPLGTAAVGRAALGAVVLAGAHAVVHLAAPGSLGAGDVKLAGPVGAVLAAVSWPAVPLGAAFAALLSAALALAPKGAGPGSRQVPHGPSMLGACWAVVVLAAGAG